MACPGFILARAEKNIRWAEKNSGGAESRQKEKETSNNLGINQVLKYSIEIFKNYAENLGL